MISNTNVRKNQSRNLLREGSFTPMQQLRVEADSLFDEMIRSTNFPWIFFGDDGSKQPACRAQALPKSFFRPSLNVIGTDLEYKVSVELPGVAEQDIKVEVMDKALIISGEKKHEQEQKNEETGFYHMERSYGQFKRVLEVPADAVTTKISAAYKDGVLNINIPRKEQVAAQVKKIEISKE